MSNKIDNAIGWVMPFGGLKKHGVDAYVKEIESSNLSPEMKMITIANTKSTFKHLQNQYKIARIAQESAKEVTDFSESSTVNDEWLERYMDSSKFVSDEEMQIIWGNILAKEFEEPGSTPPSLIRILSEITPKYANIFQNLCSLAISIFEACPDGVELLKGGIFLPPLPRLWYNSWIFKRIRSNGSY